MSLGLFCLSKIGWGSLKFVVTYRIFLSNIVCDQVPEQAIFPRDSADKHHVITAPYILLDGIPLSKNHVMRLLNVSACFVAVHLSHTYADGTAVHSKLAKLPCTTPLEDTDTYILISLLAIGVRMSMEYNTMMITGQKIFRNDSLTFGQAYDQDMQPIYEVQLCIQLISLFCAFLPFLDRAAWVLKTL